MIISENRVRRIIREELHRESNRYSAAAGKAWVEWSLSRWKGWELNESQGSGEIELDLINGARIARMLRDSGETLLASLIMNHDRPGASEYIWDEILKRGRESQRAWDIEFPLKQITFEGMSLHDMGFRDGVIAVTVGLSFGQPPIYDFSERISGEVKIDVDFYANDRHGKRVKLGELRQGGLSSSGKRSPPPGGLGDIKYASFALQDVSLDYLEHLVARRAAFSYI